LPDKNTINEEQLQKRLRIKQLEVNSLLEVTQAINNNLSVDKLFRIYEFILRAQITVQKMAVFIRDTEFYCICSYGVDENWDMDELTSELLKYNRLVEFDTPHDGLLAAFDLLIPVFHKDQPLAYALMSKPQIDMYETLEEKIKFIQTITNIIVVAIENKRLFRLQIEQEKLKQELELAAQVQSHLIPKELPNNNFLQMAAIYLPHRNIGGDYYDYIDRNEDEILFCIADISGKGVAAAILMANFQAILRTLIKDMNDLGPFIKKLNARVLEITRGEKFLTLFFARFLKKTRELEYVNAGHNPSILIKDNQMIELGKGCTILGMFESLDKLEIGKVQLGKGESLLINYTDGLTDLENEAEESFGIDRLLAFLNEHHGNDMTDLNNRLMNRIMDFKGKQMFIDDISVLSCRFKPVSVV